MTSFSLTTACAIKQTVTKKCCDGFWLHQFMVTAGVAQISEQLLRKDLKDGIGDFLFFSCLGHDTKGRQ